jgi:ribosomal protein L29
MPPGAAKPRQSKREELDERCLRLEGELSNYRYP